MTLVDTSRILDSLNYSQQVDERHTYFSIRIGKELFGSADGQDSINFPLPDIMKDQVFLASHHRASKSKDWTDQSIWLIQSQKLLHLHRPAKNGFIFIPLTIFKIFYEGRTQ